MSLSPQNLQTPEEMLERWAGVQCQCDPDVGFLCECCHDTQVVRELIKERDRLREKVPINDFDPMNALDQKLQPAFGGKIDIPSDVASREFAEWLADQYRLAMRKGAELATNEMRDAIESKFRQPDTYIATYERDGWDHARRSVERWLEGDD